MICGAEACNLGAMIHGAELRVHFLKSFQKGSTCENLSQKGLKSKKKKDGRRAPVGRRSRRPRALLKWTRARTRMATCVGNTRRLRVRGVAWRRGSGGPEEAAALGPAASLRRHWAPARTIGTASGWAVGGAAFDVLPPSQNKCNSRTEHGNQCNV
jgi:hypothetical protein